LIGAKQKWRFRAVRAAFKGDIAFEVVDVICSSLASRKVLGFGYCTRQASMGDSMRRRDFITILGGAAATQVIRPGLMRAGTSPKRPIIGIPGFFGPSKIGQSFGNLFRQGLEDLGYVLGRDLDIQARNAGGDWDRLPAIVEEIVQLKPDVIYAFATLDAVAARKATSTIPIVCAALADAVHLGLIASEARPGGNVTGIEPYVAGLPAKQIEVAREIVPGASTVGLLTNSKDPKGAPQVPELEAAGQAVGLKIVAADTNRPEDIEDALRELANKGVDVVIVLQTGLLVVNSPQIAAAALAMRLPTVYGYREHVIAGGLISYRVDLRWCYHRSAYFVDKILHGAAPGDLPIEFPTQFPLSINLKTAKELGLTVPPTLLARADEVIE
jgi:putative ABC transport system substrate-binding protein